VSRARLLKPQDYDELLAMNWIRWPAASSNGTTPDEERAGLGPAGGDLIRALLQKRLEDEAPRAPRDMRARGGQGVDFPRTAGSTICRESGPPLRARRADADLNRRIPFRRSRTCLSPVYEELASGRSTELPAALTASPFRRHVVPRDVRPILPSDEIEASLVRDFGTWLRAWRRPSSRETRRSD